MSECYNVWVLGLGIGSVFSIRSLLSSERVAHRRVPRRGQFNRTISIRNEVSRNVLPALGCVVWGRQLDRMISICIGFFRVFCYACSRDGFPSDVRLPELRIGVYRGNGNSIEWFQSLLNFPVIFNSAWVCSVGDGKSIEWFQSALNFLVFLLCLQ